MSVARVRHAVIAQMNVEYLEITVWGRGTTKKPACVTPIVERALISPAHCVLATDFSFPVTVYARSVSVSLPFPDIFLGISSRSRFQSLTPKPQTNRCHGVALYGARGASALARYARQ